MFQAFSLGMLLCHVPRPLAWAKVGVAFQAVTPRPNGPAPLAFQAARLSGPYRAAVDLAVLSRRLAPTAMGVFPLRGGDILRAIRGRFELAGIFSGLFAVALNWRGYSQGYSRSL